jgi:DNA-binding SARP family transcriptional activator
LTLRSFGEPVLVRRTGDREELVLDLGKPLALVTYLACAPGRAASREHLIDLLWSDLDREAGLHGLRQALWHIKKRVCDGFISAERETVRLLGNPWFDREDLLAAAEAGDFDRVNSLYEGDFFGQFATPGSGEFERWADLERSRLRSVFIRCVDRLARLRLGEGRAREAVDLARRIRDVDLLHQPSWRLVIEALLAASDPLGAAVESDAFERLVREEELEPEPATRALLAQARQAPEQTERQAASAALVAELIGREREFATVLHAWRQAQGGNAAFARVVAPAGLGKTRLISDVAARIRAMRGRAIVVRANPGAREVPYALASELAGVLGALPGARAISPQAARILVSLNPSVSSFFPATDSPPVGPGDEMRQRMHTIHELIAAIADEEPLALFIDDLHWADSPSRQMLAGVFGLLGADRVLIVVAERGQTIPDTAFPAARFIPLMPLALASVTALVTSIAELPHERWTDRFLQTLHGSCAGSPLLVLETLHLLMQRALLVRAAHTWTAPDVPGLFRVLDEGGAIQVRVAHLSEDERLVLSVLATAGVPLGQSTIERAAALAPTIVAASVRMLENQALVARRGEGWQVAHDEIAGRVLDSMSDVDRRSRMGAVGRAVLAEAGDDAQRLRFSARYLQAAEDRAGLNDAFVRFVRVARTHRDRRGLMLLAEDLLGASAPVAAVRTLVSSVSLRDRAALLPSGRIATAGAVLTALLLGAAAYFVRNRPAAPVPNAVLAVALEDARGLSIYEARLDTADWTADSAVRVSARGRPRWFYPGVGFRELRERPGHQGTWIAVRAYPDSGAYDLVLLSPERGVERLTQNVGDDLGADWSPDGEHLVFATGRWNWLQHYDLAIFDLKTRRARMLTSGDPTDGAAHWSPDGTRIAFRRKNWDGRPDEICVVRVDGSSLRCATGALPATTHPDQNLDVAGWLNESALFVGNRSNGYARVDATTLTPSDSFRVSHEGILSPNGHWIACQCDPAPLSTWTVFHMDRTATGRPVVIDTGDDQPTLAGLSWSVRSVRPAFADRVAIDRGQGSPRVRVPHHVSVDVLGSDRRPVSPRILTFASSDSSVATVDSLGTVAPLRSGTVTITASLGGWRRDTATLRVVENAIDTLLSEHWSAGVDRAWTPFGDPRPVIVRSADGSLAYDNRGDGRFTSGAHTSTSYSSAEGIAIDLLLSTPISLPQWQYETVSLVMGLDSARLFGWDHRTADPATVFPMVAQGRVYCELTYPGGPEGPTSADLLAIWDGHRRVQLAAPKWMRSGALYRVRLQVLPDGRCGVAINGVPVLVGLPMRPLGKAYVFLHGSSVRTKILAGPVTILRGVPTDADWDRVSPAAGIRPLSPPAIHP